MDIDKIFGSFDSSSNNSWGWDNKSYNYYNNIGLGNTLADYVDQGGGVVCMMFECGDAQANYLHGRWNSEKYYVIINHLNIAHCQKISVNNTGLALKIACLLITVLRIYYR